MSGSAVTRMPRPLVRKLRRQLTKQQRFQRAISKLPGEDPLFPVVMHSIERYLQGVQDASDMDAAVQSAFKRRRNITTEMLQEWVTNWHALSDNLKSQFVPRELRTLTPADKLDMNIFHTTVKRCAERSRPLWTRASYELPNREYVSTLIKALPLERFHVLPAGATITDITPHEPDGSPYVYLGQPFTIHGTTFSSVNENNTILVCTESVGAQSGISFHPKQSAPDKLDAIAPSETELAPGKYLVQVKVAGKAGSNFFKVMFGKAPSPAAVLTTVNPAAQFVGKTILVSGSGINPNPLALWIALDPAHQSVEGYSYDVTRLSTGQVTVKVPERMISAPGDYLLAIAGANQPISNFVNVTVKPYRYEVEFMKMKCIDESDPEWCGDDELVTRWVIACDEEAWSKGTPEYSGFSDNTEETYTTSDRHVFLPDDGAGEVRDGLIIGTLLLEWDAGDAKAYSEAIDAFADIAKAIPVAGTWVSYALMAISKLISWFGGDPDTLGEKTLAWKTVDLWANTNNSLNSFTGTLDFLNDDDTGSYRLTYKVSRVEQ